MNEQFRVSKESAPETQISEEEPCKYHQILVHLAFVFKTLKQLVIHIYLHFCCSL